MSQDFLPPKYEIPEKPGNFLKFVEGTHKFRILSSPILGWEAWTGEEGDKRTVKRFKYEEPHPMDAKHFWAMTVFNYGANRVQILSINQATIQQQIKALAMNEDWGSPLSYDITVVRTGKGMNDTKYSITPSPKKPLSAEAKAIVAKTKVDMEDWMNGGQGFADGEQKEATLEDFPDREEVNPDDIPFGNDE